MSSSNSSKRLLKTVPGFLISAVCLWWTFRGFHLQQFRDVHLVAPIWVVGVVLFSVLGYGTRCYRWWRMLRSVPSSFAACSRIFMTSLAANNILPFRIGDVMRIFTYADDLNTTPSVIMSTVLLEKLLDVFTLAVLMALTLRSGGGAVSAHLRLLTEVCVAISTAGVLVMVFGAKTLEPLVRNVFARTEKPLLRKVEHWLLLALDCIRQIGVVGTLLLVLTSFVAWIFEGLLYVSASHAIGLVTDAVGPWQAVGEANLSFLVPSSPGGIGPFELACKDALMRHGTAEASAAIFGLLIHLWLLIAITGVGGAMFFAHRLRRGRRLPLVTELETLPAELP